MVVIMAKFSNSLKFGLNTKINESHRVKLSDLISTEIKRYIVENNLMPGDRLPQEKELIKLFASSKGTIRECLKSLEVEGLVKLLTGRNGGTVIREVPYQRAMQLLANYLHFKELSGPQIYQIRRVIEPLMAESVVGLLKTDDFKLLDKEIIACTRCLDGDIVTDKFECHRSELEFHNIIARACPNPFLSFICRFINDILLYFTVLRTFGKQFQIDFARANLRYHVDIVEAYKNKDRKQVRKLMTDHMDDAAVFIEKIGANFEQGLIK